MNDLSKLLDKLETDAKHQREAILTEARQEAAQITASYESQANAIEQEILSEADHKIDELSRRTKSQCDITLRNSNLTARRHVLGRAFEQAVDAVATYDLEQLLDFFAHLACQGQTEDAVILLNEVDAKRLGPRLIKRINAKQKEKNLTVTLAEERHQSRGGFILRQGDIDFNCTIEVLVQQAIPALEAEVADLLFPAKERV